MISERLKQRIERATRKRLKYAPRTCKCGRAFYHNGVPVPRQNGEVVWIPELLPVKSCPARRWWNWWRHDPPHIDLVEYMHRELRKAVGNARTDALINGEEGA